MSSEMHIEVCTFTTDAAVIAMRCRIRPQHKAYAICNALLEEAQALCKPRLVWRQLPVQALEGEELLVGGQTFNSPLFRQHLQMEQQLYPFIASCGPEAEEWSLSYQNNTVQRYVAEAIKEHTAEQARQYLYTTLRQIWQQEPSEYSPGSLPQLPLTLQQPLFALLREGAEQIGVTLTEGSQMLPLKSMSGILFCSSEVFCSCQLCQRFKCPKRRKSGLRPPKT